MYHNVCDAPARGGVWRGFETLSPSITNYFVDRGTFTRHCTRIAECGLALDPDELWSCQHASTSDGSEPRRSHDLPRVLLTFDDGWKGTWDIGGPILEQRGLRALLFVTTDLIGHPHFVSRSRLKDKGAPFLIGSHARSHRLLAALPDTEIRHELSTSRAILEEILGEEVNSLACPGGSFDRRVLRLAFATGYRFVFTSQPNVNRLSGAGACFGRLAVKRGTTVATVSRWLRGDIRRERCQARGLAAAKRLLGRSIYGALRSRVIAEDASQLEMTDLATGIQSGERF